MIMTAASPVTDIISYKNSTSSPWGRMRMRMSQRMAKLTTTPSCRNQRTGKNSLLCSYSIRGEEELRTCSY
jgi:hypothetical protein